MATTRRFENRRGRNSVEFSKVCARPKLITLRGWPHSGFIDAAARHRSPAASFSDVWRARKTTPRRKCRLSIRQRSKDPCAFSARFGSNCQPSIQLRINLKQWARDQCSPAPCRSTYHYGETNCGLEWRERGGAVLVMLNTCLRNELRRHNRTEILGAHSVTPWRIIDVRIGSSFWSQF